MTRYAQLLAGFLVYLAATSDTVKAEGNFDGEWRTSIGIVTLKQTGSDVTGVYGNAKQFKLKGTVEGRKLTFEYQEGAAGGHGQWTLDDSGHSFTGDYQLRGGEGGEWTGWRPDPEAPKGKRANLGGLWLTNLGLMDLSQTEAKVTGHFAVTGVGDIEGTVRGRRLKFTCKFNRPGKGWFDVSEDGATFSGAAVSSGEVIGWIGWHGRRAPEFVRHVKLAPSKIVDGSTSNLLTYSVRAPESYKEGDGRKWPAVVILHGSNMNGRAYVSTIAAAWPEIAKDYLLVGINGEMPSEMGDDPKFNYTYVDFVGRSTFKGFLGTDRESPALVAEALDDLRTAYPISRYFVGGHSQGGFLTYSLLMNYPEKLAGAFPVSGNVIFQCDPSAFTDEKLRAGQRAVPLTIVHGKNDPLVGFASGKYAAEVFGEAGWPAFRFFADDTQAGHRFALLPVDKAIRWLEVQASDDPARLLDFAEKRAKEKGGYRDAVAAVNRIRALKTDAIGDAAKARLDRLAHDLDAKAEAGAKEFLPKIRDRENQTEPWIDAFLAYRDDFEFAAPREVMQAFEAVRAEHEEPAKIAVAAARNSFQLGKSDEGYRLYQDIMDKYYAASFYRHVKRLLAERK